MDPYDLRRIGNLPTYLKRIIMEYALHNELMQYIAGKRPYNLAAISEWHGHDAVFADVVDDSDRSWHTLACVLRFSEPRFISPVAKYFCTPTLCALPTAATIEHALMVCCEAISQNRTHGLELLEFIKARCIHADISVHGGCRRSVGYCDTHTRLLASDTLACAAAKHDNLTILRRSNITSNVLFAAVTSTTSTATFQWIYHHTRHHRTVDLAAVAIAALDAGSDEKFYWLIGIGGPRIVIQVALRHMI